MPLVQKIALMGRSAEKCTYERRKVRTMKTDNIQTDRVKQKLDVFANFARDDGEMKRGLFYFFGGRRVDFPSPPSCPLSPRVSGSAPAGHAQALAVPEDCASDHASGQGGSVRNCAKWDTCAGITQVLQNVAHATQKGIDKSHKCDRIESQGTSHKCDSNTTTKQEESTMTSVSGWGVHGDDTCTRATFHPGGAASTAAQAVLRSRAPRTLRRYRD